MRKRKFEEFAALHVPGDPLILYNAWDVGSARAVASAGAKAVATGSWSVAAAQGFGDGEELPLEFVLTSAVRIAGAVSVPVTIDFEGGYAIEPEAVGANTARLSATGAVGCNFEDQVVGGAGFHPIEFQAKRIAAARAATGPNFFINARIDLFLNTPREEHDDAILEEAIARAIAYSDAGASGIFVPGLADLAKIRELTASGCKPINVIPAPGADVAELADAGVARISYGPRPYFAMLKDVEAAAQAAFDWQIPSSSTASPSGKSTKPRRGTRPKKPQ
ncbi:isocitrate lyase/phosphoenolpyruvate mutase family protein [soil metagenome]